MTAARLATANRKRLPCLQRSAARIDPTLSRRGAANDRRPAGSGAVPCPRSAWRNSNGCVAFRTRPGSGRVSSRPRPAMESTCARSSNGFTGAANCSSFAHFQRLSTGVTAWPARMGDARRPGQRSPAAVGSAPNASDATGRRVFRAATRIGPFATTRSCGHLSQVNNHLRQFGQDTHRPGIKSPTVGGFPVAKRHCSVLT
jgi:hypothetical protein